MGLLDTKIVQVESGTVITDLKSGDSLTVTDTEAVHLNDTIYATEAIYEMFKRCFPERKTL